MPEIVVSFRSESAGENAGRKSTEETCVAEGSSQAEKTHTKLDDVNEAGSQDEEESMWDTTSEFCSPDSDPWSDGSVANLFA